jgi:hypothetical protein
LGLKVRSGEVFSAIVRVPCIAILEVMPTIAAVNGITIAMYYNDHDPPHFHAIRGGVEFRVRIADLTVLPGDGGPPAMERTVLAWAAQHQAALALCWARAHSALPPGRI